MSQKKGAKGGCPRITAEPNNVNLRPNLFRDQSSAWIARKARRGVP